MGQDIELDCRQGPQKYGSGTIDSRLERNRGRKREHRRETEEGRGVEEDGRGHTSNRLRQDGEPDPGKGLKSVVWTRDEFEEESARDLAVLGALRSQVTKHEMNDEVSEFTNRKKSCTQVSFNDKRAIDKHM